jgi:translation elongation factor EF-G
VNLRQRARPRRITRADWPSYPIVDVTVTIFDGSYHDVDSSICKHILHTLEKVRRRFPGTVRSMPYRQRDIAVHLSYGTALELRLLLPDRLEQKANALLRPIRDKAITDLHDMLGRIRRLEAQSHTVTVYPDAEEYIQTRLTQQRIAATVATSGAIRKRTRWARDC